MWSLLSSPLLLIPVVDFTHSVDDIFKAILPVAQRQVLRLHLRELQTQEDRIQRGADLMGDGTGEGSAALQLALVL